MPSNNTLKQWLPERYRTTEGGERRVGVELEFANVDPEAIANTIVDLYGGRAEASSRVDWVVKGTCYGSFEVELDWSYYKSIVASQESTDFGDFTKVTDEIMELLTQTAEILIPWEVVTPPIPMSELSQLNQLINLLRMQGALGTRHSSTYAFGMHLNPELPAIDTDTILSYMRAYLCLYDWIIAKEKIDITRRLSNYIRHFDDSYIKKIIAADYSPTLDDLIDDYLENNATRNRSLDMLPLFAYLDQARVAQWVKDNRVKSRPTLHYRLPNCDIDNAEWGLHCTWALWLQVEQLANSPDRLRAFCDSYLKELNRLGHSFDSRWLARIEELVGDI